MCNLPAIDIQHEQWQIVHTILQKNIPQYEVWAFGSRVKGKAKRYSDLDLAVISQIPLPLSVYAALSEDFSESDLPWRVDIVDWATTSTAFRDIIKQNYVVIQQGTDHSSP